MSGIRKIPPDVIFGDAEDDVFFIRAGVPSPNKVAISHLTRLRRHASLVGSCASARIRMPRVLGPGSSAFVGVEFS